MFVGLNLTFIVCLVYICTQGIIGSFANGEFTTSSLPNPLWSETTLDKLKKDLLINYDKYARHEEHYNLTGVRLGLAILHVETDELKSTVTLHAWLRMVWSDSRLKWNESDYGGIDVARISDHEIWLPDIYLHNSANGPESIAPFGNPNLLVYPNGEVLWVPPVKLTAMCQFTLRRWPFDTQYCQFTFLSWRNRENDFKLSLYNSVKSAEIESSMSWSTWNISNSTAEIIRIFVNSGSGHTYKAKFNLTLVRKSGPYKAIVVTPAVVIGLLILTQFWLPPQAREKCILNGFVVVAIVMFLTYFTDQIAAAGSGTPLIITFYGSSLYMICFSMLASTAVLSLSRIKKWNSLPWAVRKHLKGKLGKYLLLEYTLDEISTDEYLSENHIARSEVSDLRRRPEVGYQVKFASDDAKEENWILAMLMDRILFLVYIIIILTIITAYLI